MIDAKTLRKCIDNLAEINALVSGGTVKKLTLEIGYILKQELDNVNAWNQQFGEDHKLKGMQFDVNKLIEDNTQLVNENKKLFDINMRMKQVIDKKIPSIENAVNKLNVNFETVSQIIK